MSPLRRRMGAFEMQIIVSKYINVMKGRRSFYSQVPEEKLIITAGERVKRSLEMRHICLSSAAGFAWALMKAVMPPPHGSLTRSGESPWLCSEKREIFQLIYLCAPPSPLTHKAEKVLRLQKMGFLIRTLNNSLSAMLLQRMEMGLFGPSIQLDLLLSCKEQSELTWEPRWRRIKMTSYS